ncbi:MAG: hypothetical protein JO197_02135 [Acidobacteria bacterium]|nr:hypothetical protein [Acidobacteriota bacterium]MBV9476821.1 hypothetical protein [Acidobacteriota bacterium]
MDFVLRILFSGMIAFIPSADQKELNVVLLNTHGYQTSDGTTLPHHQPFLLARAQSCTGSCERRDPAVATFFYSDKSESQALDALEEALAGGAAWQLAGSDISVHKPDASDGCLHPPLWLQSGTRGADANGLRPVPSNGRELSDFSWVTSLDQVSPTLGPLNASVLSAQPPSIVAARLKLDRGKISTYSLVRIDGKVKPLYFRALGATENGPYAQAGANWVMAEIRVPGDAVELISKDFAGGATRTMHLTPLDGVVEVAVLNIPSFEVATAGEIPPTPGPGTHFEEYYQLAQTPPATRPIPHAGTSSDEPAVEWRTLDPDGTLRSELLTRLRIEPGRGIYDRTLCPMIQY